jgi:hypothetical protein
MCSTGTIHDSHENDLIFSIKTGMNEVVFSFTPLSSTVFSSNADDEMISATRDFFPVAINSSISIYFQNINRFQRPDISLGP